MAHIPAITGSQMAEVDALMMERIGVNTFQLMELAGYAIADAARQYFDLREPRRIVALAGTGGNGGDAMVAARLLTSWGHQCTVLLVREKSGYRGVTADQLAALQALKIPVIEPDNVASLPGPDLIIDGLLGFSLRGNPKGEAARLIALANAESAPTLAIDVPSGLNADTGEIGEPCIVADRSVTLALPKTGLMAANPGITGSIVVADIGIPASVYTMIGLHVESNMFAAGNLVSVR